jgi:hypothetical protein
LDLDVTTNAAANLVDLEEVIPEWDGGTPATLGATTTYTGATDFAASTLTAITGSGTIADKAALDALTGLTEANGDYKAATADGKYYIATVAGGDVTASVEMTGSASYATAKGSEIDNTTLADLAAAQDDAKTKAQGDYFYATTDGGFYKINVATDAVAGTGAVKTKVGEALLVAPGAPSYEMTLTYKRWKKTSSTQYSEIEGTVTKTISRSGNAAFKAGDSYNIVVTLYKDGDAATDTNITPWNPSADGDIDIEGEE